MSRGNDVDGYTPGHGDPSYDVSHYDLELTYKVEGNLLNGVAQLRCVALTDLDRITLDLHGLRVRKVGVDGSVVKYTHRRHQLSGSEHANQSSSSPDLFGGPIHTDSSRQPHPRPRRGPLPHARAQWVPRTIPRSSRGRGMTIVGGGRAPVSSWSSGS